MSDDIKEVSEFDDAGSYPEEPEVVAPQRLPRWLLYVGGLVAFNVLSYVFDWGWILW